MSPAKRQARARRKARANRLYRWRHRKSRNPLRAKPRSGALLIARGAGSINAESDMQQLVRAGHEKEAAVLYERHMTGIFYRVGEPRLRWGHAWYQQYKLGIS